MDFAASARAVALILTRDRTKAKAFYGGTLGFPLLADDPFASVFSMNGIKLRITQIDDHMAHAHPMLGWEVPDIEAAVRALRDRGVTMNIYDGFGQDALGTWTSPDGKSKVAFFNDPDANALTLASD